MNNLKNSVCFIFLRISRSLFNPEFYSVVNGIAKMSTDPDRVKINTIKGPVWLPYVDVEDISIVIRLRVEGKTKNKKPANQLRLTGFY